MGLENNILGPAPAKFVQEDAVLKYGSIVTFTGFDLIEDDKPFRVEANEDGTIKLIEVRPL